MKYHNSHFSWLTDTEFVCIIGIATGRVSYLPKAKWLYSFRMFFGLFKAEILWTTKELK